MTRRLLMVCYQFPPAGGIPSLRALRFARHLRDLGWQATVLCSARPTASTDPSLDTTGIPVVRAAGLEWPGLGARVATGGALASGGEAAPVRTRLRAVARRWVYFPDGQIGWYWPALQAARALLRERRFDALFSTAYPMTSHLLGLRLQRETGLPWVADFRDLWSEWCEDTPRRQARERRLEDEVLARAAAVTTVSPTYVEHLARRGARRATLLTNAFDEEAEAIPAPWPPIVGYLGTYYPGYQDHLLAGLEGLARVRSRRDVRLRFIGTWPGALGSALERLGLLHATTCTGFLPYPESVRALASCGVLLVAGPLHARTPEVKGNVAAKAFEYLAAHRPILMVGDPESDLGRILEVYPRARVVGPGRPEEIAAALEDLLDGRPAGPEPSIAAYQSRNVSARLARLLDEVVKA